MLFRGELRRLVSYKILPVSLATTCLWIVLVLLVHKADALTIAPLLIFIDTTVMLILLIGAFNHLEKQEETIKTMLVLPISIKDILISKVTASMVLGFISVAVMSLALGIIHGITFNYAAMLGFVFLIGAAHAGIGFFLALHSKDFGSMLGLLFSYMFLFTVPSVLFTFGVIGKEFEWPLMLLPSHSSSTLISTAVSGSYDAAKVIVACIYLALLAAVLLRFAVFPKFKDDAVRR